MCMVVISEGFLVDHCDHSRYWSNFWWLWDSTTLEVYIKIFKVRRKTKFAETSTAEPESQASENIKDTNNS